MTAVSSRTGLILREAYEVDLEGIDACPIGSCGGRRPAGRTVRMNLLLVRTVATSVLLTGLACLLVAFLAWGTGEKVCTGSGCLRTHADVTIGLVAFGLVLMVNAVVTLAVESRIRTGHVSGR